MTLKECSMCKICCLSAASEKISATHSWSLKRDLPTLSWLRMKCPIPYSLVGVVPVSPPPPHPPPPTPHPHPHPHPHPPPHPPPTPPHPHPTHSSCYIYVFEHKTQHTLIHAPYHYDGGALKGNPGLQYHPPPPTHHPHPHPHPHYMVQCTQLMSHLYNRGSSMQVNSITNNVWIPLIQLLKLSVFHEQYVGVNGKMSWWLMKKIHFWLRVGWVGSYLQRSLSAQVKGGSRCQHWPLKTAIFCGQGLRRSPW